MDSRCGCQRVAEFHPPIHSPMRVARDECYGVRRCSPCRDGMEPGGQDPGGHLDSPLTLEGIAQAKALGNRLRGSRFDLLLSSDLGRASATARYIAAETGLTVVLDARLRERHYGIFQGMTRAEAQAAHPEIYRRYSEEDIAFAIPGGESTQACFERSIGCLEELAVYRPGQRILVVTHGGVVDGLYRHTTGLPHVGSRVFTMVNGVLTNSSLSEGRGT